MHYVRKSVQHKCHRLVNSKCLSIYCSIYQFPLCISKSLRSLTIDISTMSSKLAKFLLALTSLSLMLSPVLADGVPIIGIARHLQPGCSDIPNQDPIQFSDTDLHPTVIGIPDGSHCLPMGAQFSNPTTVSVEVANIAPQPASCFRIGFYSDSSCGDTSYLNGISDNSTATLITGQPTVCIDLTTDPFHPDGPFLAFSPDCPPGWE